MAKSVRASNGAFGSVQGAAEAQALFAKLPKSLSGRVQTALDAGADAIVAEFKATAPVATEFEAHPGQLRDSAHVEQTGRSLSVSVVVDAVDKDGHPYPAHVEFGHKTEAGGHVAAKPALFPAYRKKRAKIRRDVASAIKAGVAEARQP